MYIHDFKLLSILLIYLFDGQSKVISLIFTSINFSEGKIAVLCGVFRLADLRDDQNQTRKTGQT